MAKNTVINSEVVYGNKEGDPIKIEKCLDFQPENIDPKAPSVVLFHPANDGIFKWDRVRVKVGEEIKLQTVHLFERAPAFIEALSRQFPGSNIYFLNYHTNDDKTKTVEKTADDFRESITGKDSPLNGKNIVAITHSTATLPLMESILQDKTMREQILGIHAFNTPFGYVGKKTDFIARHLPNFIPESRLYQDPIAEKVFKSKGDPYLGELRDRWNKCEGKPYCHAMSLMGDQVVSKRSALGEKGEKPGDTWVFDAGSLIPTTAENRRRIGGAHRAPMGSEKDSYFKGEHDANNRSGGGHVPSAERIGEIHRQLTQQRSREQQQKAPRGSYRGGPITAPPSADVLSH